MPKHINNFIKMNYNTSAFTLLELMLVVTIIAISTGAVVPSFNSFINSQGVKQAAEQIKSDLRSIQSNALSNQVIGDMQLSNRIYWWLYLQKDSDTYYYFVTSEPISIDSCVFQKKENQKFTLPSNNVPLNDYCIMFDSLDGAAFGSTSVVIKSLSSEKYECLTINSYGLIDNGLYNLESSECE